MSNFIKSYQANVGLNHVPAYQVSGQPFAEVVTVPSNGSVVKVEFPYVTRWFCIHNNTDGEVVRVSFSENGMSSDNYFRVHSKTDHTGYSPVFETKVSEIYLMVDGSTEISVDVIAGLTSIPTSRTATDSGTNWSGSAGVG